MKLNIKIMRMFLMDKGFKEITLDLLNDDNLIKLANNYGFNS